VWAGTSGYLDDVPVEDISRFESEFLDYLQQSKSGIYDTIRETGQLSDDTLTALKDAIEQFRNGFETHAGEMLVSEAAAEGDASEVEEDQETVKKYVPKSDSGASAGTSAGA
jgi:F-type H+-transporting ATPase subunit alpha